MWTRTRTRKIRKAMTMMKALQKSQRKARSPRRAAKRAERKAAKRAAKRAARGARRRKRRLTRRAMVTATLWAWEHPPPFPWSTCLFHRLTSLRYHRRSRDRPRNRRIRPRARPRRPSPRPSRPTSPRCLRLASLRLYRRSLPPSSLRCPPLLSPRRRRVRCPQTVPRTRRRHWRHFGPQWSGQRTTQLRAKSWSSPARPP